MNRGKTLRDLFILICALFMGQTHFYNSNCLFLGKKQKTKQPTRNYSASLFTGLRLIRLGIHPGGVHINYLNTGGES